MDRAILSSRMFVIALLGVNPLMVSLAQEPIAHISFPPDQALVRGNVPVFGQATCPDFELYRLEYGEGTHPTEWKVVKVGTAPQLHDPYETATIRWDPHRGAKGNLATWETGITEYKYGRKYAANLLGVYTLRLVVEGRSGIVATDQARVEVGRVITNKAGGTVLSPDAMVTFVVAPESLPYGYLILSIRRSNGVQCPKGYAALSPVYTFRPPGVTFIKPCTLELVYHRKVLTFRPKSVDGFPTAQPPASRVQPVAAKVAIYQYEPVRKLWRRLKSVVDTQKLRVKCSITAVPQYVAYYAVLADVRAPSPPRLQPLPAVLHHRNVELAGEAEPECSVALMLNGDTVSRTTSDADGCFYFQLELPFREGVNALSVVAMDAAQNCSPPSAPLTVRYVPQPPSVVRSFEVIGPASPGRGMELLVMVHGDDPNPHNIGATRIHLTSSVSDPKGIDLELTETAPDSGVYATAFALARETSQENKELAASKSGEAITIELHSPHRLRKTFQYMDRTPPSPPSIRSSSHPALLQETFEDAVIANGRWTARDGAFGGVPSRVLRDATNAYLRVSAAPPRERDRVSMGIDALKMPYWSNVFPLLAFDYRMKHQIEVDLLLEVRRPFRVVRGIGITDKTPYYPRIGKIFGAQADDAWHHAEVNVHTLLRRLYRTADKCQVGAISFGNYDGGSFLKRALGSYPYRYGLFGHYYAIDNFAILNYSDQPQAVFEFTATDENGIAGYSLAFDMDHRTVPDELIDVRPEKSLRSDRKTQKWVRAQYIANCDGRWYFHVRAVDTAGNWGRTNHYMIIIDRNAPIARAMSLNPLKLRWDDPVWFTLDDGGGAGIEPYSICVQLQKRRIDVENPGVEWDPQAGKLLVYPAKLGPRGVMFANGESVRCVLTQCADRAGHPIPQPVSFAYEVSSPLQVIPPNGELKGGWYRKAPQVRLLPGNGLVGDMERLNPTQDILRQSSPSVIWLRIRARRPGAASSVNVYEHKLRVDNQPPETHAVFSAPSELLLNHRDYVIDFLGLFGEYFANSDFTGPLVQRYDGPLNFNNARPSSTRPVPRAQSGRWTGWLYVDKSQKCKLELVTSVDPKEKAAANLWLDGQLVVDAAKRKFVWSAKQEVFLAKGFHEIRITYVNPSGRRWWLQLFSWRGDKEWRELIPAENLLAKRSVATTYYRWDNQGKWHVYKKPITAPAGKHVLYYYSKDEAGHVEKVKTLQANVAEPKAEPGAKAAEEQ